MAKQTTKNSPVTRPATKGEIKPNIDIKIRGDNPNLPSMKNPPPPPKKSS